MEGLLQAGGNWVNQNAVVDENWVTSRGSQDLPHFVHTIVDQFRHY